MDNNIHWTGYEFEYKERTADWFWAVGIIFVCITIVSFLYGNAIFGLFILLSGIMVLINSNKPPRLINYELTTNGLMIDDKLYPYIDFKTFWVTESKFDSPKLLLRTNKITNPIYIITIETDYVDPKAVRDFLLDHIPEEEIRESLSLKFMDFLGF